MMTISEKPSPCDKIVLHVGQAPVCSCGIGKSGSCKTILQIVSFKLFPCGGFANPPQASEPCRRFYFRVQPSYKIGKRSDFLRFSPARKPAGDLPMPASVRNSQPESRLSSWILSHRGPENPIFLQIFQSVFMKFVHREDKSPGFTDVFKRQTIFSF